jgi:hypothetical protein
MSKFVEIFYCKGFGCEMQPFHCIENQISIFCLEGIHPCWECENPCTITVPLKVVHNEVEKTIEKEKVEERRKIPKGMTKSVAKSMGYI